MRYRIMGDRRSSVLCLGTMFFGSTVTEERSLALLDRFFERGGNFVDTAQLLWVRLFWGDAVRGISRGACPGVWFARVGACLKGSFSLRSWLSRTGSHKKEPDARVRASLPR